MIKLGLEFLGGRLEGKCPCHHIKDTWCCHDESLMMLTLIARPTAVVTSGFSAVELLSPTPFPYCALRKEIPL